MNYLSVAQTAEKWKMSPRRVQVLCNEGRIDGAQKVDSSWIIPQNAVKPADARKKVNKNNKINVNISIEREWAMPKRSFCCIQSNIITNIIIAFANLPWRIWGII